MYLIRSVIMVSECFKDIYLIRRALIVILIPLVLLPLPLIDGTQKSACGYVILIMAVFWITEALPIPVTALIPVFMFPIIGLLSVKEASQQYVNDKSMLLVGSFIVAAAVARWNIHRRIALRIMLLFGTEPRWLLLGIMIPTWFLSFWICNCSSTTLMLPITYALLLQLKDSKEDINERTRVVESYKKKQGECCNNMACDDTLVDNTQLPPVTDLNINVINVELPSKESQNGVVSTVNGTLPRDVQQQLEKENSHHFTHLGKAFTLGVVYAANVGGIATMTGAASNLVFIGYAETLYEKYGLEFPITFANWMGYGLPTSFVLVIFVWIWLQIYFSRSLNCCSGIDKYTAGKITKVLREEYEELGSITFAQGVVIVHFVVLIILWITRDMGGEAGWGHWFKDSYIKEAVPVVIIASILFVFPSKIPRIFCCRNKGLCCQRDMREEPSAILSWKYAVDKVPWGVIFLLGSGFCIAKAAMISGLSAWLGSKLSGLDYMAPWVLCLVLCYIVTAMTEIISNPAVCTLMMPIISALAIGVEINPLYLMFPAALTTSFAFMLPAGAPTNAIAFSYGYVKVRDMVFAGFFVNIVCVLVLMGATETIGQGLFNFHTMPEAFLANMTII